MNFHGKRRLLRGAGVLGAKVLGSCTFAAAFAVSGEALASTCSEANPATLMQAPFTSHWDAYERLACLEENLLAHGDRRAIFVSVYALTTLRMAESIDSGAYQNTVWMQAYQTEFANHYRKAFYDYQTNHKSSVPLPWIKAFDAAQGGRTLLLQDVILGMNAHITYDLAFALEAVGISPRSAKKADHTKVNDVLAEVSDETLGTLQQVYGPNLTTLDVAFGPLDEVALGTGMAAAREQAWSYAVALTDSSWWNRWTVESALSTQATSNANLTLAVTFLPSTNSLLHALEGTSPSSTFCQTFPCAAY